MKTRIFLYVFLFVFGFISVGYAAGDMDINIKETGDSLRVIPYPKFHSFSDTNLTLPDKLTVYTESQELNPLIAVLKYEYQMLAGGEVDQVASPKNIDLLLQIDHSLDKGTYRLEIGEPIILTGADYSDVAAGSITLMHLLSGKKGKTLVPKGIIKDYPDSRYRGLLVDTGRKWHEPAILKQIVLLCRWYKINYLQLHLTDNELFTFPTETYPELPTPDKHYTRQELQELDEFARNHGVTLVPEIDMPGHAGQFVNRMPELFGISDWQKNEITINIGKEEVYTALDQIIGEVAEVFQKTPYIHIGADEASFEYFEEDPSVREYMKENEIANVDELYRHFLVRMNEVVKKHGKRTIVWEGFKREGEIEIPKDITVMAWETMYQLPHHLIADGYTTINVSWQPLYITGDRKWSPEDIYKWNLYRWENWLKEAPAYEPIQLKPDDRVIGASMASWAQSQYVEMPTISRRLPAMNERIWNATLEPERSIEWFNSATSYTDSVFKRLISPIEIRTVGLADSENRSQDKNNHFWFNNELTLSLKSNPKYVLRYTLDGSEVTNASEKYLAPLVLKKTAVLKTRAFTTEGEAIGYPIWRKYELRPIEARVEGDLILPLSELWKTRRSWEAPFKDSVNVHLTSKREGIIRFTTDGTEPTQNSKQYKGPITLSGTTVVTAVLFSNDGEVLGEQWRQHFHKTENTK